METDADRLNIIQAVSAARAIYHGIEVAVIFDQGYAEVDVGVRRGISATRPIITGREIDFPGLVEGAEIVLGAKTYRVTAPRPDGTGLVEIDCREVNEN